MKKVKNANDVIQTTKKNGKEAGSYLGDIVFLSLLNATSPITIIEELAKKYNLDIPLPKGIHAQGAFRIAVRKANVDGYLVREIIEDNEHIIWGAVAEDKDLDKGKEALAYDMESRVMLLKATGDIVLDEPSHPVASVIKREFSKYHDAIDSGLVRRWIKTYAKDNNGIPIGSEWFVPSQHETLSKMRSVVNNLGASQMWLLPVFSNEDADDTLSKAASDSFKEDLTRLKDEVETFTEDSRLDAMENRLKKFGELKALASLYAGMLNVSYQSVQDQADKLEAHVKNLLGIKTSKIEKAKVEKTQEKKEKKESEKKKPEAKAPAKKKASTKKTTIEKTPKKKAPAKKIEAEKPVVEKPKKKTAKKSTPVKKSIKVNEKKTAA